MVVRFILKYFKPILLCNIVASIPLLLFATLNLLMHTTTGSICYAVYTYALQFASLYYSFQALETFDGLKEKKEPVS